MAVLTVADTAALTLFGLVIGWLRHRAWLPSGLNGALDRLYSGGALASAELSLTVLLCLIALGAYGAASARQAERRRLVAAALGMALPALPQLWPDPTLLVLAGYLVLVPALGLALILGNRLAESLLWAMTLRQLCAARVLLVAGRRDIRRARRHPAVSDRREFAVSAVFDPDRLRSRGALEELCEALRRCRADTIVLCCGALGNRAFGVVLDAATAMGCGLVSLARTAEGCGSETRMVWTRGGALMVLASPATRALQRLVKRAVDVLGASAGLFVTFPLMIMLALAVRLESPGPVFFAQRRVGAGGRPFRCFKVRTMRIDAEEILDRDPILRAEYVKNNFKLPEGRDPRITRLGRVLRRTSLDELPQLWNVLRGEMSLVGPRPVVPDELQQYGETSPVLLSVKPGMVGAWAIGGRSRVGYPHRADIELGYVRTWRFGRDLSILWRTLPVVFARRGAY